MDINLSLLSPVDYVALIIFLASWAGYQCFANSAAKRGIPSLMSVMSKYREDWWRGTIHRDLKIVDANIIMNLSNGATFFASTTILILGALLALLGTSDKAIAIMSDLPFSSENQTLIWELKIFLLLSIFVYAFFKFTWSLRQHTFCSVLVGAAPDPNSDPQVLKDFVVKAAELASVASNTFNYGLRAYYFGLSVLTWFWNSWFFIVATLFVVTVLYYREFKSEALKAMIGGNPSKIL